jgi:hypothetical protein
VAQVAVEARSERPGVKRLVAYVVPASTGAVDFSELRAFAAAALPDYMVPSAFVELAGLPLSRNGKLDRGALPEPDFEAGLAAGYLAPRGDAERVLAEIWSEVLGVRRIGVEDNFFELGGDSILSIQVVSRARQAGLGGLTPRDLFTHQTVAALAANATEAGSEAVERGPVSGPAPLTPIQHWFFDTYSACPQHFDQSVTLELVDGAGGLDTAALRTALAALVEHHDALRMRFELVDGRWQQRNAPVEAVDPLHHRDLSTVDPMDQAAALAEIAAEVHASFDLAAGPLLKAVLFDPSISARGRRRSGSGRCGWPSTRPPAGSMTS